MIKLNTLYKSYYLVAVLLTFWGFLLTCALTAQAQVDSDDWTLAEVIDIDIAQKSLLLRHGAIKKLGIPPLTMRFKINDTNILKVVQVGDFVRIKARALNRNLWIESIEVLGQYPLGQYPLPLHE